MKQFSECLNLLGDGAFVREDTTKRSVNNFPVQSWMYLVAKEMEDNKDEIMQRVKAIENGDPDAFMDFEAYVKERRQNKKETDG